ncbi:hypothetical protein L3073_06835 [Ancylomarina sp. DW003]|nr:hypothetical protein [Ancylomarina sp. DW003]MDE5421918.1 hypothetical protein [Ancylomarina sp. DW003]
MLDKIKGLYHQLPKERLRFLRNIPNRMLYGKSYSKTMISYDNNIIKTNLFEILQYSKANTHHGRKYIPKKFNKNDVFGVLKDLPFVTSNDISENIDFYTSKEYSSLNSYQTSTGGTGRNPTPILLSNESYGIEWAHMHSIWGEANYRRKNCPKLTLRGTVIKNGKLFEYNPIYNEYVVNTYLMCANNIHIILDLIRKYNIRYIHGYPSLVKEFTSYLETIGESIILDAVFLGSEGISTADKSELANFFKAKIISWYGQTEKIILASDCLGHNKYKVFSSYGYPSVTDKDESGFGELIGTTFVNKALPLINYKTGDYARVEVEGNNIYLTDVQGRWGKDFIYVSLNKRVPTSSINLHSSIQKEILFYQIIQDKFGEVNIKILLKKDTKFTNERIIDMFKSDFKVKLADFTVSYEIVLNPESIVRSTRGKMIMLVQNLSL